MGNSCSQRLDWEDAFKGVCIIEIVLMHIHYDWEKGIMPEWILVPYFVPAFFFISGTFHKNRTFKEIIRQKTNTLLVPFFLWYVLALALKNVNGALWFLIGLFEMILFTKAISLLKNKWLMLMVSLPCAACGMLMMAKVLPSLDTFGIIPIASILWFQVFYILGMLWGEPILNLILHEWNKTKIACFVVSFSFVCAVNLLPITQYPLNLIPYMGWQALAACCFIFGALQICYWFRKYFPPLHYVLRFFGYYSLIVLAIHMPIYSLLYNSTGWDKEAYCSIFTVAFFIGLIPFCLAVEKWCPALLGRKRIFK